MLPCFKKITQTCSSLHMCRLVVCKRKSCIIQWFILSSLHCYKSIAMQHKVRCVVKNVVGLCHFRMELRSMPPPPTAGHSGAGRFIAAKYWCHIRKQMEERLLFTAVYLRSGSFPSQPAPPGCSCVEGYVKQEPRSLS